MTKLTTVLVGCLALVSLTAQAQQSTEIFPLAVMAQCTDSTTALDMVSRFNEIPFVTGTNNIQLFPNGNMLEGTLKMFVDPETWSYTIFITDPTEEFWCMLTSGQELTVGVGGNGI